MPLTNGDVCANIAQLVPETDIIDFTKAQEYLQSDFPNRDGLDVWTLLDSRKNGGLTYNDFLILPGYIGILSLFCSNVFLY